VSASGETRAAVSSDAPPAIGHEGAARGAAHPTPHTNPLLLYGMLGVMMLLWCGNYLVAKAGFREIDGVTMGVLRVILAALIMVPIYLVSRWRRPPRRALHRSDYAILAWLGLLGMALNQVLFVVGLSYTTVGHSSFIVAVGPVNILLFAWLMGLERLSFNKVAGIALSFTGVAMIAAGHGFNFREAMLRGDLITLCGSLAFSLYAVFGKKFAGRFDTMTLCAWNYFLGALMLMPLAIWRGVQQDWSRVTWRGWGALFYMAVASSVLAYFIWYWALHHLAATRIGVVTYIQPVLGTLLGVYVLHEVFTGQLFLAGLLVLGGVAVTEWHPKGAEEEDESVEAVDG
jgi:drug/metabolite transporter (DMT)-like permease